MLEKLMLPLIFVAGVVLYVTRDDGFQFDTASAGDRIGFTERQTKGWVHQAGLLPMFRSELIGIETREDGAIAIVRIQLGEDTTLIQNRQRTYAQACAAYMQTRLAEFSITETVRFESDTGALKANFSFKPGTCARYAPKPESKKAGHS